MTEFVKDVYNPRGDGNCGFRCAAKALGYADDDGWFRVRQEMLQHVEQNQATYEKKCGGQRQFQKLLQSLTVKTIKDRIPVTKWLSNLSHGQILADTYSRPICFLGDVPIKCSTFIPHRTGPKGTKDPIYISFVKGNHWVLVYMAHEPVPIPPPMSSKSVLKVASKWPNIIRPSVLLWQKLVLQSDA